MGEHHPDMEVWQDTVIRELEFQNIRFKTYLLNETKKVRYDPFPNGSGTKFVLKTSNN
jgi:hypothetical protein